MSLTTLGTGWGMELESVMLKLPRELLSGAQRVASAQDVTIGHLVRVLLKREVERQMHAPCGPRDTRLLAALGALLAGDMVAARDWDDLAKRLRPHGYALHPAEGDLTLVKVSCGTRVCNASDLGFGYGDLVRRFGTDMPGHTRATRNTGVMPAGELDNRRKTYLGRMVTAASGWHDLIAQLASDGMELRPEGAGLAIYATATGRHLCNTAAVGADYRMLAHRFGGPLPGRLQAASHSARRASGEEEAIDPANGKD